MFLLTPLAPLLAISVLVTAALAEYTDSTLGMGYGTSLTPLLLLFGFPLESIVPAILLSEFLSGIFAGFTHHAVGNVDIRPKTMNICRIYRALKALGLRESFRRGVPRSLRVAIVLAACSIIGTVTAVLIALELPKRLLQAYVGILISCIGLVLLIKKKRERPFSWKRITLLGIIASCNKGISGGGYGPVITGGQLLSGVDGKNAVAITSLAEGLTCLVGVVSYSIAADSIDWQLAPYLLVGSLLSVPFSALTVRKIHTQNLHKLIGLVSLGLGILSLGKLLA